MIVTFCGHREVARLECVRTWLTECVEELILQGATDFYLGGYGAFDAMAAGVVRQLKSKYPHICSVLVLAYLDRAFCAEDYDLTTYPPIETVPKRYAVSRRNQWMVEKADVVVAYVCHDWGGAAAMLEYARRKRKQILLCPAFAPCQAGTGVD